MPRFTRSLSHSCTVLALAASALPGMAAAQTSSLQDLSGFLPEVPGQTVIYTAREFITMNPKKPRAEAIAVRDGKFLAVGTRAEVGAAAGKDARLDKTFNDKVVIAGLIEPHVHPMLSAVTMSMKVISIEDWDAIDGFSPAVRDPAGYEKRLLAALDAHRNGPDKNEPFVTWGYHHYMHGDKMSRALLNKLAPDFPVVVWHRSTHEFFFNDLGLEAAGIDKAVVDALPKSAREQVNWERGHFWEQGQIAVYGKVLQLMISKEKFLKGLQFTEDFYHRAGLTTVAEPGGVAIKPVQDLVNSVYSDDATPFNHYFIPEGKTPAAAFPNKPDAMIADAEKVLGWGSGRTRFLPRQVKLLTDGAIFSQLMQMKDGYTDGHHGEWIMDPPVISYTFQAYWDAGYQIHVHNNGDAGFDVLLGELEKAMARKPRQDHRAELIHFGFARPEQVERWIKLGGIISSNPYYVTALAGRYGKLGMTEEWAQNMVPHGEVLEHGGRINFHSDMPMAPAKPLQLVWSGVNRSTYEGTVAGPQHKVPLDVALEAVTINAAHSLQLEKTIGSIEVGKDANLTVLEQSPYAVAPEKLKDIPIWGTMLEGRVQPLGPAPKMGRAGSGASSGGDTSSLDADLQAALVEKLASLLSRAHEH